MRTTASDAAVLEIINQRPRNHVLRSDNLAGGEHEAEKWGLGRIDRTLNNT